MHFPALVAVLFSTLALAAPIIRRQEDGGNDGGQPETDADGEGSTVVTTSNPGLLGGLGLTGGSAGAAQNTGDGGPGGTTSTSTSECGLINCSSSSASAAGNSTSADAAGSNTSIGTVNLPSS